MIVSAKCPYCAFEYDPRSYLDGKRVVPAHQDLSTLRQCHGSGLAPVNLMDDLVFRPGPSKMKSLPRRPRTANEDQWQDGLPPGCFEVPQDAVVKFTLASECMGLVVGDDKSAFPIKVECKASEMLSTIQTIEAATEYLQQKRHDNADKAAIQSEKYASDPLAH